MTSQHSDPPPLKRGSTKRSDSLSLRALLGPFFRHKDTVLLPLQRQDGVLTFSLSAASSRTRSPSGRTTSNRPRNCGNGRAHALRFRRLKPWACAAAVLKNTDIFSMALPTVSYLDSEGDLSVLFAVAHFKLCGVERTPCTVGKARLQVNVQ